MFCWVLGLFMFPFTCVLLLRPVLGLFLVCDCRFYFVRFLFGVYLVISFVFYAFCLVRGLGGFCGFLCGFGFDFRFGVFNLGLCLFVAGWICLCIVSFCCFVFLVFCVFSVVWVLLGFFVDCLQVVDLLL